MTTGDIVIRSRLASALDDADAIETRPIEEVRAELKRLGVDPGASIALAKALSRKASDPAARLLQQSLEADDLDAEIAALETAPIEDVEATLPAAVRASATAAAEHRRGPSSPVSDLATERRRRRFSSLGFGGSLIGIAASALLFIAVRPDRLEQGDQPLSTAESAQLQQAEPELRASKNAILADSADAELDLGDQRSRQPGESEGLAPAARLAPARAEEAPPDPVQDEPPIPATRPALLADDDASPALVEPRSAPSGPVREAALPGIETPDLSLPDNLKAVLVIDADGAPPTLTDLADVLPGGGLASRLDDARALAEDRTVVALIAFVREGERVEAAIVQEISDPPVLQQRSEAVSGITAFSESTPAVLEALEARFELIELPSAR